MPGAFFVILNELLGFFCHSEPAFGLGRIPLANKRVIVVRPSKVAFIMIRPMNKRDSSLAFRMT